MIKLRAVLFYTLFVLWNVLLALTCLWVLLLPRRVMHGFTRFYLGGIAWLFTRVAGTPFRVIGRENLPATPCILAAKHQAPWETMILPLLGKAPAIVLKRELMAIPLWGWYARRYGNVPVDRGGRARAMQDMLAAAKILAEEGRDLLIFPQGTRLAPGEWRPYKVGVAGLYQRLGVPVVPVALNSGLFWDRSGRLRRMGTITVEILPPIPPGLQRDTVLAALRDQIELATDRLSLAEGGPVTRRPSKENALWTEVA